MQIRPAQPQDFTQILEIYQAARLYMKTHGNPNQWGETHPEQVTLEADLHKKQLYVLTGADGKIHAAFVFFLGIDPSYAHIDGAWLSDGPYGCIHRVASDGMRHGVFRKIAAFAQVRAASLRIDTHADNHIMQHAIEQAGFVRCGTIRLPDGSPRIAYQYLKKTAGAQ